MMPRPLSANWRRTVCAVLLVLALGGGLVQGFAGPSKADEDAESAVSTPPRVTFSNGVTVITLDAATQQSGGIETAPPTPPPPQDAVLAYATVLDASQLTDLSNRYLDAKAQLQIAEAKLTVSRAALERAKTLYKDQQNMSAAQLQSAEGSFEIDRAALAAAGARLTTLVASAQQSWGPVLGQALVDGTPLVAGLIARRDYLVKTTLPPGVFLASAPETALARLGDGTEAKLRFVSLATTIDPKIQGASYFYSGSAASGILPGLNLMASLPSGHAPEGVVVPDSAVVWLQGKAWIFLRTGPQTFVRRLITTDRAAPDGGYLVSGLPSDAQIAVRGAQMLLSEEFRAQVRSEEDER